jgi:hypothetical protein
VFAHRNEDFRDPPPQSAENHKPRKTRLDLRKHPFHSHLLQHTPDHHRITIQHLVLAPTAHATMPSLVDLPPELINQIHLEHEQILFDELTHEEQHERIGIAAKLGSLRLTNRYIERATRRSFTEYFGVWNIKTPNDADIQWFCDMAKTPDLAASVKELNLFVDDDYSMRVQGTVLDAAGSEMDATHVFDSGFGAVVPAAYFRNRDALIGAFGACVNVAELWFRNVPLDLDRMERYTRETLGFAGLHAGGNNVDEVADDAEADGSGAEEGGDAEDGDEDES